MLLRLNDEGKIIMKATGIYHLPILHHPLEAGLICSGSQPVSDEEIEVGIFEKLKQTKKMR